MHNITLTTPANGITVQLLNDGHKAYLNMPHAERVVFFADEECRAEMKKADDAPLAVDFAWCCDLPGAEFTIELDTSPEFTAPITLVTRDQHAALDNLFIGTAYHWRVTAIANGHTVTSATSHFVTDDTAPRLLRISGINNVRDLGGWRTTEERRVRQGLIYRTGKLNENSYYNFFTADELRTTPALAADYEPKRAADEELIESVSLLQELLDNYDERQLLPCLLDNKWTVFRPDPTRYNADGYATMLNALTAIPIKFLDARPEIVMTDSKGTFVFDRPQAGAPALFMQKFHAPADGLMRLGCGADWYWDIRLNGRKVFDKLASNEVSPVSASNYQLLVPVRKGPNLITVQLLSGSASWTWCCADCPVTDGRETLATMIAHLQTARDNLWRTVIHKETGDKVIVTGIAQVKEIEHLIKGTITGRDKITAEGARYMINELGIRSDIDIRYKFECEGMTGSPLGDAVKWYFYPSGSYTNMNSEFGRDGFTKFFKILLDRANYPLFFHCAAGQDRTGAVAFILNGLLDVPLESLYLDWEVTGFWNASTGFNHAERFDRLIADFTQLPGDTMHAKIKGYVLSLGFTEQDIATFRTLMLE